MKYEKKSHHVSRLAYHIVWVPKYRHHILIPAVRSYLERCLPKVIRRWDDVELVDYAIASDHVHLILRIGITEKLCSVIGSIKQFTASKLRAAFPFLRKVYWKEPVVWARGYFVGSVGTDEKKILAYVRGNQC